MSHYNEVGSMELVKEEDTQWKKWFKLLPTDKLMAFVEKMKEDPVAAGSIGVTLLVGFVTVLLLVLLARRLSAKKQKTVLIVGPSNSGKTTLFSKLSGSDWSGTVTSQCPNFGFLKNVGDFEAATVQLIDLPGSPRLANHIPKHVKNATVVIFMIDSAEFLQNLHDTAEKLCLVLDDPAFKKRSIPMLIALNKSDLGAKCNTEKFVCTRLQKEIDQIRKQSDVKSASARPFEFEALRSEVSISKISVVLENSLGPVYDLLRKYVQ